METTAVLPAPATVVPGAKIFEEDAYEKMGIRSIPYQSQLSLRPLIRLIESKLESADEGEAFLARLVMDQLEKSPQFQDKNLDCSNMAANQGMIEMMSLFVLAPALRNRQYTKLMAPFDMVPFYLTPALKKLMSENEVNFILADSPDKMATGAIIRACGFILNRFYDLNLAIDSPVSISITNYKTGQSRYFKIELNFDFVEIKKLKPLKKLSEEQIHDLYSNIFDVDLWLQYLPADAFAFEGFVVANLIDITQEEASSRLKHALLEPRALTDPEHIQKLETILKQFFNMQDLKMGLTAIDYPKANATDHPYKIRFDFLADEVECLLDESFAQSVYDKACRYGEVILIEDLKAVSAKTPIEQKLLAKGFRSILVAPLFNSGRVIGLLEIGSPRPFALNSFTESRFKDLVGLFAMSVARSRDEMDNRIEAIMRDQFTALHPSVTWRFTKAAFNLLEKRETNPRAQAEEIVFEDVYPLYGQADIVGSSTKRNHAIQSDLILNLKLAGQTLKSLSESINFPLLDQLNSIIDQEIIQVETDFSSNDETRVVEFIHQEIHPVFHQIREEFPRLSGVFERYFRQIDPNLDIVYLERKKFEDSVSQINQAIGDYLDHSEEEMQSVLPHYFEKYKTDGVEYDLYIGQSLLRTGKFSNIHLRNFRLWQLIHMVGITNLVKNLGPQLPTPLTTAQLVFAYTSLLSIKFRQEEKQFDVDGAYNVRYEILKKRIDKATIEGTDERLTQANKIAIVYLHDKDRQEYLSYLNYMARKGMIQGEIEDLHLARLQGVQGLKALRVEVA